MTTGSEPSVEARPTVLGRGGGHLRDLYDGPIDRVGLASHRFVWPFLVTAAGLGLPYLVFLAVGGCS